MEEKEFKEIDENETEEVSAGGSNFLTCRRCGCRLSVGKWRDNGGYCSKCLRIIRGL